MSVPLRIPAVYNVFITFDTGPVYWLKGRQSAGFWSISVCNQPVRTLRSTQPGHPFVERRNEYSESWGINRHTARCTIRGIVVHCVPKTSPTFSIVAEKPVNRFWQFLIRILLTQLAIKRPLIYPPHLLSASALPRETRSSKICVLWNKQKTLKNISDIIDCNSKKD